MSYSDYFDFVKYGTSEVDWCEHNFTVVSYIAEFFNTISNFLFFVIPPLSMYLFKDYGNSITNGIHLVMIFLMCVGTGSVYFHATLSFAGQLMDELFILWVFIAGYSIFMPKFMIPKFLQFYKNLYYSLFIIGGACVTYLSFLQPKYNAYFLMIMGLPSIFMLAAQMKNCKDNSVRELFNRTMVAWVLSIFCWILDKFACIYVLHIPYFHAIFHLLITISAYSVIVLHAYFKAKTQYPESKPQLQYWPSIKHGENLKFLLIPYVMVDTFQQGFSKFA